MFSGVFDPWGTEAHHILLSEKSEPLHFDILLHTTPTPPSPQPGNGKVNIGKSVAIFATHCLIHL